MSKKNDGGPAFPRPHSQNPYNNENEYAELGMSLRDYFASDAMKAILTPEQNVRALATDGKVAEHIANDAYIMADAMLVERLKGYR